MPKASEALESADPEQNLRWAARRGDTEKVMALLDAGVTIHTLSDAPLRYAAENGHTETVEALLDCGADPFVLGAEPLRKAEENGHTETAQVLRGKMHEINREWQPPVWPLAFKVEDLPDVEP